jgi:thiol:disulfide interchange protein DsbC
MKKHIAWFITLTMATALLSITARAGTTPETDSAIEAKIRATLHTRYPAVSISHVSPAMFPGLYELITDAGIAYTDSNGDYLFLGKIVDTKTQEDLTQARWDTLNAVEFDKLPFNLAIKFVKGDGKRRVAIFEDPHCPYCRQIETELQKITNTTVYVFMYPIESLHPGASETARDIWCADDRAAAWTNAMLNKQKPAKSDCKREGFKELIALGDKLNINATPTLFFPDGRRRLGAMPSEQLEKELDGPKK